MTKKDLKLEDNQIWTQANYITEHMYDLLHEFSEEEKWYTALKLKGTAMDMLHAVALAVANTALSGREYEWSSAHKQLFALKTMYRFAGRQKFITIDPEVMVKIDTLLKQINKEVVDTSAETEAYNKKDLEHWRQKVIMSQDLRS